MISFKTESRFVSGLGYTALSLARRRTVLKELLNKNPSLKNSDHLKFQISEIEKYAKELRNLL